jgi:hypothetical protein
MKSNPIFQSFLLFVLSFFTCAHLSAQDWSLSGNAGTVAGTHFVGTTDNQDLLLKRFGVVSGQVRLSANGQTSTSLGVASLPSGGTASNTAIGGYCLFSNTTGTGNAAWGEFTLAYNTTGDYNTASGYAAMQYSTRGGYNVATGYAAMQMNTTGSYNTASGQNALRANTTGSGNVAVGQNALQSNSTGGYNSATGCLALFSNTTGTGNTAVGHKAGMTTQAGGNNTAPSYGTYLGYDTKTKADGSYNETVVGYGAVGNGSNTVTIGNASVTDNYFTGNVRAGAFVKPGGTAGQFLKADGSVDATAYQPLIPNPVSGTGAGGYLSKWAAGNGLAQSILYEDNGNLGVGTTSPQYKLDVKGQIRATEVLVHSVDQFADFVFDKGYRLPSLDEVDGFIRDNGHLPGIPSAQEVKDNGLNLLEMQVKLLQKVEELTLYSIRQQEEIKALKDELHRMKDK